MSATKCHRCEGLRGIVCPDCEGEGCETCGGDGDRPCPKCNPNGEVPMSTPDGCHPIAAAKQAVKP